MAKIFSPKAINREAFVTHIPRILQANNQIEVGFMGDNIFLLNFKSLQDKKRAISGGPFCFFRDLIIFREPCGLQTPSMLNYDELSIWVQCYNLPLVLMHKYFLVEVGRKIGKVEEVDTRDNGIAMGRYARIRVRLDIKQPLKKHIRVHVNQEEEEVIILLSCERLPDFCYSCGRIGHSFRDCETSSVEKGNLNYGSWLKAPNRGGGVKPHTSSPKKSSGKSESTPTSSSSREADEPLVNNSRALVLQQSTSKKALGDNNMKEGNKDMLIQTRS